MREVQNKIEIIKENVLVANDNGGFTLLAH